MKPYRALLLLLAIAVIGAFAWQQLADDPGQLLLLWRGWQIETSLVVAVLALIIALGLLYGLIALLRAPLRWHRQRRQQRARERLAGGLLALHEGRWLQAEKKLRQAAGDPSLRLPALLYASRAAHERGDLRQSDALLAEAAHGGGAAAALPSIERLLDEGRAGTACELLDGLARHISLPPRALELQARALIACGRSDEAVERLPLLRRAHVRDGEALRALEAHVLAAWLRAAEHAADLERRWATLDRTQRLHPALVLAYGERAHALGDGEAAAAAIERALAKGDWDDALARCYGRLRHADHGDALRSAERWLEKHPDNPSVLLALGRLCRQDQLWGKAEAYLARAIATGAGAEAWEALAETHADQHDDARARQAYANALRAGRGEPVRALLVLQRAPTEAPTAEERSSMGLPRLPAAQ